MKVRAALLVALIGVLGLGTAAPASARPVTVDVTIPPTTIAGTDIVVSGTLSARISHFSVRDGHVVAVAKVSGTLTATSPTLGTATIAIAKARVVLNADVQADCQGHLDIDFHGVLQLKATVTFTGTTGTALTVAINETVPVRGSLSFSAQTAEQTALICAISELLSGGGSAQAIVDELNALLEAL